MRRRGAESYVALPPKNSVMGWNTCQDGNLVFFGEPGNFTGKGWGLINHSRRRDKRQHNRKKKAINMVSRDRSHNTVFFCHRITSCMEKTFTENIFPCFRPNLWRTSGPAGEDFQQFSAGCRLMNRQICSSPGNFWTDNLYPFRKISLRIRNSGSKTGRFLHPSQSLP